MKAKIIFGSFSDVDKSGGDYLLLTDYGSYEGVRIRGQYDDPLEALDDVGNILSPQMIVKICYINASASTGADEGQS